MGLFVIYPAINGSFVVISPPSPSSVTYTETLLQSGTVQSLGAGQWIYLEFNVPSNSTYAYMGGSYTSNNNVEVGILTSTEYGAFTQNHATISNGVYYSGDNGGATLSGFLVTGNYYLVIYDGNFITSDTVSIVNTLQVTITATPS